MESKKAKKTAKKSMVYWVVFEHWAASGNRKAAIAIQLSGKQKITQAQDILTFQAVIKQKGFPDAVVIDWKELGLQETMKAENA